ncbi:lysoplasmalogenase [Varanus komodoensis]|uniref:lysoplasmalogenase n=1 Tax=Varanus komodoensis TaxID=61221 RepID=UPI001CF7826A|nr:lysoplasmalogenase [Varanus komodoensis]
MSQFFKLLPFLASCMAYFILWLPEPSIGGTILKCLPTLCLKLFVATNSYSAGAWTPYTRRIFQGLLLSAVGDACLVWPNTFLAGLAAFAGCHACYILAFGLRPLRPLTLLAVGGAVAAAYTFLLLPCLKGLYVWAAAAYTGLLGVMAWRALARRARWPAAAAGSLFFVASDLFVGLDKFCSNVAHARALIMSTYYTAQLLITFSAASQRTSRKES